MVSYCEHIYNTYVNPYVSIMEAREIRENVGVYVAGEAYRQTSLRRLDNWIMLKHYICSISFFFVVKKFESGILEDWSHECVELTHKTSGMPHAVRVIKNQILKSYANW